MPRIYLIVQNSVRTGPFTLEELLQQPLQADAMVWIIGQSEDWLSPLEIPSLQGYYIQQHDGSLLVHETVLNDIQAQRFAAPAGSLGAEQRTGVLDARLLESSIPASATSVNPVIQEKETEEPKVIPVSSTSPQTHTSFARSASILQEQSKEKEEDSISIARRNWAVVGIALVLIVFITWNALFNDSPRIKRNMEYAAAAASLETTSPSPQTTVPATEITPVEGYSEGVPVSEEGASVVVPNYASQQVQPASTDGFLDSVQRVLDSQDQLMAEVDDVYRKSFWYKKRYNNTRPVAKGKNKSTSPGVSSAQSRHQGAKVPLSQQVHLQSRLILDKNKQQVNTVELMVRNNSKEVLKTVSVDVYYYKKGEKLLNKETVYFSNLYPKQSLTKSIAGNQRATTARFQLGTITPIN